MFVQMNTKSEYSFLDSVVRLEDYLESAERLGYRAIGICDNANLYAALRFARGAKGRGLLPIIGVELTFELQGLPIAISFIAKNTQGYRNLLRILTLNNYGRTDFSEIENYLSDLALVVPDAYGNLSALTRIKAELYVGVNQLTDKKAHFDLPVLPFPAVRYLSVADQPILDILHTIRDGEKYDESLISSSSELLQRPETYEQYFRQHFPESLRNLAQLTERISYDFEESQELPRFDKTKNPAELLRETAETGLQELLQTDLPSKDYQERLDRELSVIHEMGFDDYFLIVADLLRYARENQIYCGMGRGSAAGSLTAYALQITHVDPVKNNLFFERFLNPERVAMPDIDIDMPDDRRSELLAYMKRRYGSDHVAQIVTFSTLGKRQALRDVGKSFGMTEIELSGLTRMLSRRFNHLKDEYEGNPRFKAELLKNPRLHKIYEVASRIEGMPRQTSVHASGVVLSEDSLVNHLALKPSDDLALAQYEAPDIEAIGLLKIDFLGLRNLTLIAQMRELVEKRHQLDIDPLSIDLEDEETLALFRAGNTMGIFQFENPQMRRFLRNLLPTKFDDIVDATSIFRPGPSQFIPEFVARRHGKEKVQIIDDSLSDILSSTYGIMIYQEQIMQVAQRFAGFSLGKADLLRRAISKKKGKEFEELRADFLAGAQEKGHTEAQAIEIYELIERFANYGFNRSHAYAYGALAFQIAYFKAHYPDEFYEVQLHDRKREVMIADAVENGLSLSKPLINRMPYRDRVKSGKIALGLAHVATLPRDFAYWIVENRPFKDLADFVSKLPEHFQKAETILPLIKIGTFDESDENRGKLATNLEQLIEYHQNVQLDLFSQRQLQFSFQKAEDYTQAEKYEFEKEYLGIGITPHPLQNLAEKFDGQFTPLTQLIKNKRVRILVELLAVRTHRTKNGENMAFLSVTDSKEKLDVTLFPEHYRQASGKLEKGKFYFISGKVSERNDELQLLADKVVIAEETKKKLWLNLADSSHNAKISQLLKEFAGSHQVILHFSDKKTTTQTNIYVEESELLLKRLEAYVMNAVYK